MLLTGDYPLSQRYSAVFSDYELVPLLLQQNYLEPLKGEGAMEAAASSTANSVDFKTAPNLPLVAVLAADEMIRIALRMVESSLFCGCYRMLQKLTKMSLSSINAPHRRVAKFR